MDVRDERASFESSSDKVCILHTAKPSSAEKKRVKVYKIHSIHIIDMILYSATNPVSFFFARLQRSMNLWCSYSMIL